MLPSKVRKWSGLVSICSLMLFPILSFASGITLVSHGAVYHLLGDEDLPEWVESMALQIAFRAQARYGDASLYRMVLDSVGVDEFAVVDFYRVAGPAPADSESGEIIIEVDWTEIAINYPPTGTIAELVASELLAPSAAEDFNAPLVESPVHLIGHSRGGSMICALAEDLGQVGVWVDQVTTLDPHPVDGYCDPFGITWNDAPPSIWQNVVFADNYWRTDEDCTTTDYVGEFVSGAFNTDLDSVLAAFDAGSCSYTEHGQVHTYYHGTIDLDAANDDLIGGWDGCPSDIDDSWYAPPLPSRNAIGFSFSRIAGGTRPTSGLRTAHGGSEDGLPLTNGGPQWCSVSIENRDERWAVTEGDTVPILYRYSDTDSSVTITFLTDDDTNPYNNGAENEVVSIQKPPTAGGVAVAQNALYLWHPELMDDGRYLYAKATDGTHTRYSYLPQPISVAVRMVEIEASAGENGEIDPEGIVQVPARGSVTFTATPDSGYEVDSWYWDGFPLQTGGTSITIPGIHEPHSIHVTFKHPPPQDIAVTSPVEGFTYYQRSTIHIAWGYYPAMGTWLQLDLYRNGSLNRTIDDSVLANAWDSQWRVPSDLPIGGGYQVKLTSLATGAIGFSGTFTVTEPPDDDAVIEIRTVADLQAIGRYGYYKLMNDIDIDGYDFQPLGGFSGTLNGNGFRIIDLDIRNETEESVALFRFTHDTAVIKNLTIEGGWIRGRSRVAAICGESSGLIVNCHSSADVWAGGRETEGHTAGGLVGENYGTIRNSSCSSEDVRTYGDRVGGIAGENLASGIIEFCWSTSANIEAQDDPVLFVTSAGGVAGENLGLIRECYSYNIQVDSDDYYAGGIAGLNQGSGQILNCYSLSPTFGTHIGGLVGYNDGGSISLSLAAGRVSDPDGGGLVGKCSGGVIAYCLFDTQATGKTEPTGQGGCSFTECYGKTTAQMQQRSTFESLGWDFINVWEIEDGISYPTLRGAKPSVSPPTGVAASSDRSDGVAVTWNNVTGAGRYMVFRADSSDGNPQPVSPWIDVTTFIDETALEGVTHHFWVKAALTARGAGESELSALATGRRMPGPVSAPNWVDASDGQLNTVIITWDAVPSAGYYQIYRADTEFGARTLLTTWTQVTSFVDVPNTADHEYYYWVEAAVNESGDRSSAFSPYDTGYFSQLPVVQPEPSISANGSILDIIVSNGERVRIQVSLDPGSHRGVLADWWIVADTPFGWYTFLPNPDRWEPPLKVSHQGRLFDLSARTVLDMQTRITGDYFFHFGLDGIPNGELNVSALYLDTIKVTVE
jgi:hypothetical protein